MKLFCAKALAMRGVLVTIVEEQEILQNKDLSQLASNIFTFPHSVLMTKSAGLYCEFLGVPALFGDEIDIEPYSIELTELAEIIGKGMKENNNSNNNNNNNPYTVDIPRITVFKGMTAKNLCQAMIELSKGIQGKIVLAVDE